MRSWCVVVPRDRGEAVRLELKERGVLVKHLRIREEAGQLLLPTTERTEVGWPTEEREFEAAFIPIRSYKEVARVPELLRAHLPTSFDVIGDIAVLKIPEPLLEYRREIGRAILEWDRKLRVVAQDHGVRGEFRVRDLEILAGEDRTTTTHTEFGLRYHADVARAYFSPRLGSERLRIAKLVVAGETVADPFAGVGPYAILIARRRSPAKVLASDANPVAVDLLRRNVAANRAERVVVLEGDAREVLRQNAPLDRIILDLPHSAIEFLPEALRALGPHGTIHVYAILEEADREDHIGAIRRIARESRRRIASITVHTVRSYSPTQAHVAFDVTVGRGSRRAAPGRSRTASRTSRKRKSRAAGKRPARTAPRSVPQGRRRTR